MFALRSISTKSSVASSTGAASTIKNEVDSTPQTKIGSRVQVRPGARMVRIVAIRLSPFRHSETPISMKAHTYASMPARAWLASGA